MIIAIDGPAAAGKGTLAKFLAERFNLALLDTGLLYRGVGKKILSNHQDPNDREIAETVARSLLFDDLNDNSLRTEEVARAASQVSSIPGVREALLEFQRNFANNPGQKFKGAVLDGRDIGTVVCPDAEIKIFLCASVEVRAKRRYKELMERGHKVIYSQILFELNERDTRDMKRTNAPLKAASDAFIIDTGELNADEVFKAALDFVMRHDFSLV
ncbi:MAG: Cytidylate kinase [Alphaproteobacteria bacterium MarineAlpha3_Bin5]|nr:MAG: Cytidylate kinase [Alphaproteobacteria bacterium MarineAlpha3_Bin5]